MKRIFNYIITETDAMKSIHEFLKSKKYSSQTITHLKKTENGILKNGAWSYVRDILSPGDQLTITLLEINGSSNIISSPIPINIVYEDEDIMVINKPCNMPIHPSQGNYENTLANAVCHYFLSQNNSFVYRCINRLDRDTTGLLIIAKHMHSASILSGMVQNREIHREYLAVCEGMVPPSGTIEAPIARVSGSTIEREVNYHSGEYACTHYQTIEYVNNCSLVSLKLDTGRTHQIRVHMKHIGHPLLGDFLYHPNYHLIQRQALHSHKLSFLHPITNQSMHFVAPLPDDMRKCLLKSE